MVKLDITGQKFGTLTAIKSTTVSKHGKWFWLCKCDCGVEKEILVSNLKGSRTNSCGICCKTENLTGQKFGKWNVISFGNYKNISKTKRIGLWNCICDCGTESLVKTANLTKGRSQSCGCYCSPEIDALKIVLRKYKDGAKKRNLSFNLSLEKFKCLVENNCYYCGSLPSNRQKTKQLSEVSINYNGIDRVHNQTGYEPKNCVTCCIICNRAKSNLPFEKYRNYIKQLVSFQEAKMEQDKEWK